MIQAHGPSPWEKSNKWLSLLNSDNLSINFSLQIISSSSTHSSAVLAEEDTLLPHLSHELSGKAHISSCSLRMSCVRQKLVQNDAIVFDSGELTGDPFILGLSCALTAKKHTWGFLNCHLLSESCMHVLLLLLKYGEVAAYLWLHGLWSQLDIGYFQLCKH